MKFLKADEYQPQVLKIFDELAIKLKKSLPWAKIEHIGSSSIKDSISKGDLDIYVGVDAGQFKSSITEIEKLGFRIKEDTLRTSQLCPFESRDFELDVGVQLVENGSKFEFFLEFRDLMNANRELRTQYNDLKIQSTLLTPEEYRKVKSEFIGTVLKKQTDLTRC